MQSTYVENKVYGLKSTYIGMYRWCVSVFFVGLRYTYVRTKIEHTQIQEKRVNEKIGSHILWRLVWWHDIDCKAHLIGVGSNPTDISQSYACPLLLPGGRLGVVTVR